MKKVLFAAALLCLIASNAFAQEEQGEMSVNVHGTVSSLCSGQGLVGVEYRVAVADGWRLAPQFNIGGGNDLKTLDVTLDAHYVFDCENSDFSFYPIMGVGVAHYWWKGDILGSNIKFTDNRLFLDLGIGGEYAINDYFSVFAEVKSQWQTDYSKGNLVVGVSYKF